MSITFFQAPYYMYRYLKKIKTFSGSYKTFWPLAKGPTSDFTSGTLVGLINSIYIRGFRGQSRQSHQSRLFYTKNIFFKYLYIYRDGCNLTFQQIPRITETAIPKLDLFLQHFFGFVALGYMVRDLMSDTLDVISGLFVSPDNFFDDELINQKILCCLFPTAQQLWLSILRPRHYVRLLR